MGIGKCWDMETNGCANLQYTAASKSSSLDPTAKALANLGAIVEKDTKLSQILAAPTLTPEDKSAIVAELNKHAGGSSATVKNFLDTLMIVDHERKHSLSPVHAIDENKEATRDMLIFFTRKPVDKTHVSGSIDSLRPHRDMPMEIPLFVPGSR